MPIYTFKYNILLGFYISRFFCILFEIHFQQPFESGSFHPLVYCYSCICASGHPLLWGETQKNVSGANAFLINFLRWRRPCFFFFFFLSLTRQKIAPPFQPAQQQGQIYRKLLLAAWRDKAGDIKTSILACGIVQPAWITLLYTWEYNTWGNVHLGHHGSSSSCPFEPRHESFFYHAHRQINEDFKAIISGAFSFKGSYLGFIALKEIQIRFATVSILNRERGEWWREGRDGRARRGEERRGGSCCAELPQDGSRGPQLAPRSFFFQPAKKKKKKKNFGLIQALTDLQNDPPLKRRRLISRDDRAS